MSKYILVDFSKILEDLAKTYKNQYNFGYEFGEFFKICINENDDGDEILIVQKSVFGNTVLGKFVLIRKRDGYETKMIIDKINVESGLKHFCGRLLNDKGVKRGLIIVKNFLHLIDILKPHLGQITEYLIYVKQKPNFSPTEVSLTEVSPTEVSLTEVSLTEGLNNLFKNIKTKLLERYKDENVVNTMIKSYVGNTIDYIEPSVPLVFPDLKEGQTFSKITQYGRRRVETEVISKVIKHSNFNDYYIKNFPLKDNDKEELRRLYDFLDEIGQNLIGLNNNATHGGKPRRTRRHKNKKRRSSKQQKSKK